MRLGLEINGKNSIHIANKEVSENDMIKKSLRLYYYKSTGRFLWASV